MSAAISLPHVHVNEQNALWKVQEGEVLILRLEDGEYLELNGVGSVIWQMIAEGKSQESIAIALHDSYNVSPSRAASDVQKFVASMMAQGVLIAA